MSKMKSLEDLLHHEIKDLYNAENQIIEALPKVVSQVKNAGLKSALENHLEETRGHKKRLEEVSKFLGIDPSGKKCEATAGLIRETDSFLKEEMTDEVCDAGIIASCQRIEHYEIAGYGAAHQYAVELGMEEVAKKLEETLYEEKGADSKLTELAKQRINRKAI